MSFIPKGKTQETLNWLKLELRKGSA